MFGFLIFAVIVETVLVAITKQDDSPGHDGGAS
jgi:hypothetical protein